MKSSMFAASVALVSLCGSAVAQNKPVPAGYVPLPSSATPAAGDCATPTGTIGAIGTFSGNTTGGVNNVQNVPGAGVCSEFTDANNAQGPEDVWVVTPGTGNALTFRISGATFDPHLYILGTCGVASSCITGSDDEPGVATPAITPTLTAGTTYYVYVDSFFPIGNSDCCGSYTLNVTGTFPVSLQDFRID